MSINDGGPAFPIPMIPCDTNGGYIEVRKQGMTQQKPWYGRKKGQWFKGAIDLCYLLKKTRKGQP